jgi:hypothetical protein
MEFENAARMTTQTIARQAEAPTADRFGDIDCRWKICA